MEHPFLMFLDHTQQRSTVGRTPLDELITRPEETYRLCCVVVCELETSRMGAPYIYDISRLRVNVLGQFFPKSFACGPLLASKNNHESSVLANVHLDCPDDRYQKLKLYIS